MAGECRVVTEDVGCSCDVSGIVSFLGALVVPVELAVDLPGDSSACHVCIYVLPVVDVAVLWPGSGCVSASDGSCCSTVVGCSAEGEPIFDVSGCEPADFGASCMTCCWLAVVSWVEAEFALTEEHVLPSFVR